MNDLMIRAVKVDGSVRAFAAVTTELSCEAQRMHQTTPVATAALGRLLTAASMMGAFLKSDTDLLTLQLTGNGPLGRVLAVADSQCRVKGYVGNPLCDIPKKENGKLDVGSAVGKNGDLTVIRDLGLKEPYVGRIPLVSGEIGDDLTSYFATSEQTPSAVGLGVLVERDYTVRCAGGFIVQVLPYADEEAISKLEENVARIGSVTDLLEGGKGPEVLLDAVLDGLEYEVTDRITPKYYCNCSRERVEKALISMGEQELTDLIETDGKAQLTCHFCDAVYDFDKQDLQNLLDAAKK